MRFRRVEDHAHRFVGAAREAHARLAQLSAADEGRRAAGSVQRDDWFSVPQQEADFAQGAAAAAEHDRRVDCHHDQRPLRGIDAGRDG